VNDLKIDLDAHWFYATSNKVGVSLWSIPCCTKPRPGGAWIAPPSPRARTPGWTRVGRGFGRSPRGRIS